MTFSFIFATFHSSEGRGRAVRAPACGSADSGLIPSRVKPMTKLAVHSFSGDERVFKRGGGG